MMIFDGVYYTSSPHPFVALVVFMESTEFGTEKKMMMRIIIITTLIPSGQSPLKQKFPFPS